MGVERRLGERGGHHLMAVKVNQLTLQPTLTRVLGPTSVAASCTRDRGVVISLTGRDGANVEHSIAPKWLEGR